MRGRIDAYALSNHWNAVRILSEFVAYFVGARCLSYSSHGGAMPIQFQTIGARCIFYWGAMPILVEFGAYALSYRCGATAVLLGRDAYSIGMLCLYYLKPLE